MAIHRIHIHVDNTSEQLTYSHERDEVGDGTFVSSLQGETVTVAPDDEIEWKSSDGKFGIHFKGNDSPFTSNNPTATGNQNQSSAREKIKRPASMPKTYPYFAVVGKSGAKKHLVTADPDIIVDENVGGEG